MAKNRMPGTAVITLVCIVSSGLSVLLAQQTAVSYDATASWLQSEFSQLGATRRDPGSNYEPTMVIFSEAFVSMAGCVLQYNDTSTLTPTDGRQWRLVTKTTYWVPLAAVTAVTQVDQAEANGGTWLRQGNSRSVGLTTQSASITVRIETENYNDRPGVVPDTPNTDTTIKDYRAVIWVGRPEVNNDDLAPRLVAALNNAVAICKAQVPKSNEPF